MKKIYTVSIFAVIILMAAVILYELVIKTKKYPLPIKLLQKLTGISLILQKKNLQQNHLKTIVNLTR